jgi:hypothetical protein
MDHPDPRLLLQCPKCGELLRFIYTKPDTANTPIFICPLDGLFELTAGPLDKVILHSLGERERQY